MLTFMHAMSLILQLGSLLYPVLAFTISRTHITARRHQKYGGAFPHNAASPTTSTGETDSGYFFASMTTESTETVKQSVQKRPLGSQELLMLPRQYKKDSNFPQMNHVVAVQLNKTPPLQLIQQAVDQLAAEHPLLQARIEGDGEPDKRIDLFQMVREGDPNPPTFVTAGLSPTVRSVEGKDWEAAFTRDLDDGSTWCDVNKGPLWKVEVFPDSNVLLLAFNHAISDQTSANRMIHQMLQNVAALEAGAKTLKEVPTKPLPVSLEESVLGQGRSFRDVTTEDVSVNTLKYVAGKAAEGLKDPVILPAKSKEKNDSSMLGALSIISGRTAGGEDTEKRRSTVEFRSISPEQTSRLLQKCRENNVAISNALTAAVTYTATDFVGENDRYYKVLQSLDMRRFGKKDPETAVCMAGSHDLLHGPIAEGTGSALRSNPSESRQKEFWKLAQEGKEQTAKFIESGGPEQAVRVFDFAMTISDLNNLVHLTAQSKDTKGRAYSAGVTNVGVYERQTTFDGADTLKLDHGPYSIENIFFATPHVTSGCLFQVSAMTVNGSLQLTFNPVEPIISKETNREFADAFVGLLDAVASEPVAETPREGLIPEIPKGVLPKVVLWLGIAAVVTHAGAWGSFFQSVMEMKANADPADFWAALNFWIFFAVGHPILQPILWISDVLHGSPGPMIAGLVPVTFLLGNAAVLGVLALSKEVRDAVNIAAVAAFFAYVGSGLDGTGGLGDFNLALDDSYKGKVVKGCPAYEEVRQPSMDNFDLEKYQGLWYEQKFHDWTQFKEVYDTTLGIKLTEGGKGWIDDFAVKGPAPDAAPLSWDKSPVANGAHYFLFGRVDPNDKPGILRESGFGVEFPNYIVDVKKDPQTGEYTEAIQFQCLERGGVRVFEGINFMSRNPLMTESEMTAMHARAEAAGMYPYGASPEQMHTVARRPVDAPEIDNNWQAMWRGLGVDKLLELLTTAIEDGGR